MKWLNYSEEFRKLGYRNNFTKEEVDFLLGYAKRIYDNKVPIIYEQEHLALLVGYKYEYLLKISNAPQKFYRTFKVPKKAGGERDIAEPLPSLKDIQRWILDEILCKYPISNYAKAYARNHSIWENARFHLKQEILLTIDIKDFFPSLHIEKVFGVFLELGYSKAVATMLSNLCCLKGSLPQGAPTSPTLSNILMNNIDAQISSFIKTEKIRYTRYADDMNFSGNLEPGMIIKFVRGVLHDEGLKVNENKIRVRRRGQRQEVTGVIVNEKLQAPKEMRRKLRQSVYYIEKYGLTSHLDKTENKKANHIYHLLGIANFILFLKSSRSRSSKLYRDITEVYFEKRIVLSFVKLSDGIGVNIFKVKPL